MRRKDGQRKLKSLRAMPQITSGFWENPITKPYRNPSLSDELSATNNYVSCVSMFSGCGGMDLGFLGGFSLFGKKFKALPIRIAAAYDIDAKAIETYNLNFGKHGICGDLTQIPPSDIPRAKLLIGGFPCQDFSSCGPKAGLEGKRGRLYENMVNYMKEHSPEVVVGENVPYLEKLHNGQILETILRDFTACGYRFKVWRIACADFGLPQSRTRLFLVGVRNDIKGAPIEPPVPLFQSHRAIDDAIGDLAEITGEEVPNQSQYFVATKATAGAGQGDQKCEAGAISYTIRANAKGRIQYHYSLNRRLTVRECARLQSFPDQFVFPHATGPNIMQIGNAVPPIIGHLVGSAIAKFMTEHVAKNSKAHA
jgi:DNA (cytosine-5)-methyltransferase 1